MKVSEKKWIEVADNLTEWRKNRTSAPNLDLYRKIVSMVHVGYTVLDVGAGQCHLKECLPIGKEYTGIDPFPLSNAVIKESAEDLNGELIFDTVFMLASLDNVQDVEKSLQGLKHSANENIVILSGINIEADKYHTHKITREMLVDVLGEPTQELLMLTNVYLFEWKL